MSTAITIDVKDAVTPLLERVRAGLVDTAAMNAKIAVDELSLVRDYLIGIAERRHDSANKLGASPSKFWGNPKDYVHPSSDARAAVISVNHAGIGRAAHDVDIKPGAGKQWLTIPLIAAAYNRRAAGMAGLFFTKPKAKEFALLGRREGKGKEAKVTWVYLLVKSVHQKQDRTLLPPDEAIRQTALLAVREYLTPLMQSTGGPN